MHNDFFPPVAKGKLLLYINDKNETWHPKVAHLSRGRGAPSIRSLFCALPLPFLCAAPYLSLSAVGKIAGQVRRDDVGCGPPDPLLHPSITSQIANSLIFGGVNSSSSVLLKRGNAFSSDATPGDPKRVEEPFQVDEAETVKVTPPSADKLLVLGGSGFVGSHVIKEALDKGFVVSSLNRSGKPSISESWTDKVIWNKGNLLEPASLKNAMDGISAVVSCVGGFGSNSVMYKVNGTANINAIRAAAEKGIKRFVYVSAADFGLVNYLLQGYYEGKRAAEAELLSKFTYGGVILRPGFIHGTRRVGRVKIPLGLVGSPLQMVLQNAKPLTRLPLVGPLLTPPVSVTSVAKVAVRAATDPVFPPGIVDVYGIMRYSEQK
ncbi:hypothetical protein EJB05_44469, partial [Eragrostis curvula]